ncbi:MAG: hypothetical protein J5760_06600 [Clostridia bacterium]|nr:hypothetical protein [Clostridia bacterium]
MKNDTFYEALDNIDEKYTSEAAEFAASRAEVRMLPRRKTALYKWAAAAACLVIAVMACIAGFAVAAEAREYTAAVEFFEENGLSTEGLSRTEIKEVYRDITTRSFTNGKTAEVIRKAVPGLDIVLANPTPENLATEWYNYCRVIYDKSYKTNGSAGLRYVPEYVEKTDPYHVKHYLRCYRGDELLWCAEPSDDYYTYICTYTEFGTVVAGATYVTSSAETWRTVLALVDDNGAIVWEKYLNHGFERFEYIDVVVDNRDGTFSVFSHGGNDYICLGVYDPQGNELSFSKIAVGNYCVRNAVLLGDGYLVHVERYGLEAKGSDYIAKMDRNGNISKSFSYESDDSVYVMTDMIEFGGRVYLSAYAVPKQEQKYGLGERGEINDILEYAFSRMSGGGEEPFITDEELTPMLRENYTAVLLICDQEGGAPEKFVSVKGALGSGLAVNGSGQLEWMVESIESSYFSPSTSSFTIGGSCKVYRYTFDPDGRLIGVEGTGDTSMFRR